MATLTVVEPTLGGNDPTFVAADVAGDEFTVDDDTVLHVRNGSGSAITVTVASQASATPGYIPDDQDVAVPAGENRDVRIKPAGPFKDTDSRAQVTYSAVTTVTVAVTRTA